MNKVVVTKEEFEKILLQACNIKDLVDLIKEITDLVYDKNQDYGDAWQRYGIFTPLIRINDKILRIEKLSDGRHALINNENIEDTLKDIVGYAVLALMWLHNIKLLSQSKFPNDDDPKELEKEFDNMIERLRYHEPRKE